MVKKKFWQTGWFTGLATSGLFLLAGWTGYVSQLEWRAYETGVRFMPAPAARDNLEIIAIDEASLQQLGKWPWPRSYFGVVIRQLNEAGARTIGIALPVHTPQSEFGVNRLDTMRFSYEGEHEKTVKDILFLARQRLDTDGAFAAPLKKSGNTVLAISSGYGSERRHAPVSGTRETLEKFALPGLPASPAGWLAYLPSVLNVDLTAVKQAQPPIRLLAKYSDAGMLDEFATDADSALVTPLLLKYGDRYYPSFSLVFAALSLGLKPGDIDILPGQDIRLGDRVLDTDPGYRAYPRLYSRHTDQPAFRVHSFHEVYADTPDEAPPDSARFRGRDVLIGITAPSLVDPVTLSGGEAVAPLMITANLIENLLYGDLFAVPDWGLLLQFAVFAAVTAYLVLVLPRLRFWTGLVTSLMLLFVLLNAHFALMIVNATWVPLMLPAAALLTGALAVAAVRKLEEAQQRTEAHLFESNLSLGQHLQAQGQLDQAFEKYRECALNETLLDRLYNLGLDYERRRQFGKAEMVFEHVRKGRAGYRDVVQRVQKNRELQNVVVLPQNGKHTPQGTLILTDGGVQKPMLGRYQVEKEIGRGAMGLVYLGHDPKIGRTVAIKTMALAQEFEADELEEIRARFMREAETAGRLNHHNIVTIYDVGEEQELAYIAMDYLQGEDLSHHKSPDSLLPLATVLDIAIQVATALDFAHRHDVVHRDIKPANIIYDETSGDAKVTDFGVACLTSSSRTKTGTMLGSPSYMSPEQVSGSKVDGCSDLFSLGVTLYQLSTGKLPFVSDTMAGLAHRICNENPPDIRKLRSDIPACLVRIINKAMQKQKENRYKSGAQMAKSLRQCRETL